MIAFPPRLLPRFNGIVSANLVGNSPSEQEHRGQAFRSTASAPSASHRHHFTPPTHCFMHLTVAVDVQACQVLCSIDQGACLLT